jgi:hypothetical protein
MKKNVGLWIDHASAVVVTVTGEEGEDFEITKIFSDIENHPHSKVVADDTRQSVETEYLKRFYDEVITVIDGAESVLIFGSGEAKGELKKRLDHHEFDADKIIIESADQMTEPQIIAKVRSHFFAAPNN